MKYTQPLNEAEDASYVDGNPATGSTGSIIPAGALENPQREIVNAITDAGLTPSASSNSQLAQAITTKITTASSNLQTQINGKQATITGAATTVTGSNLTASRALTSNSSGKIAASDTTSTELGYVHGVTSNIQTQLNGKQPSVSGAATTITDNNLTSSRALTSNSSGKVAVSDTTATELGYVHGVTSAIQTQINSKQATVTGAATTITSSNLTASRALVSNSNGKVAVSSVTSTELGYLSGITSSVQTQINAKQSANDVSTAVSNMLKSLYPLGSIYIGTQSTCPLATLISGSTWQLVATDRALWGGNGSNANSTIEAGLPNITGIHGGADTNGRNSSGAFYDNGGSASGDGHGAGWSVGFDASRSNSIYGNSSTVQPPAYRVNVWRRTA